MLTLTRKPGQRVLIKTEDGKHLWICAYIHRGEIRISFDDPGKHFEIAREELLERGGDEG